MSDTQEMERLHKMYLKIEAAMQSDPTLMEAAKLECAAQSQLPLSPEQQSNLETSAQSDEETARLSRLLARVTSDDSSTQPTFEDMDLNNDGVIDRGEFRASKLKEHARSHQKTPQPSTTSSGSLAQQSVQNAKGSPPSRDRGLAEAPRGISNGPLQGNDLMPAALHEQQAAIQSERRLLAAQIETAVSTAQLAQKEVGELEKELYSERQHFDQLRQHIRTSSSTHSLQAEALREELSQANNRINSLLVGLERSESPQQRPAEKEEVVQLAAAFQQAKQSLEAQTAAERAVAVEVTQFAKQQHEAHDREIAQLKEQLQTSQNRNRELQQAVGGQSPGGASVGHDSEKRELRMMITDLQHQLRAAELALQQQQQQLSQKSAQHHAGDSLQELQRAHEQARQALVQQAEAERKVSEEAIRHSKERVQQLESELSDAHALLSDSKTDGWQQFRKLKIGRLFQCLDLEGDGYVTPSLMNEVFKHNMDVEGLHQALTSSQAPMNEPEFVLLLERELSSLDGYLFDRAIHGLIREAKVGFHEKRAVEARVVHELKQAAAGLAAELEQLQKGEARHDEHLKEMQQLQLKDLKLAEERWADELVEAQRALVACTHESNCLREALDAAGEKAEAVQRELRQTRVDHQKSHNSAHEQTVKLQSEIEQLRAQLQAGETAAQDARELYRVLELQLANAQAELITEQHHAGDSLQELQRAHEQARQALVQQAEAERKVSEEAIRQAHGEVRKLETDLADALAELVMSREESLQAQQQGSSLRDADRTIGMLQEEVAGLKLQTGDLQRELRKAHSELHQAQAQCETVQAQLTTTVAEKDIELAEYSTRISQSQREWQGKVSEMRKQSTKHVQMVSEQMDADKAAVQAQLSRLQTELGAVKRERDALIQSSNQSSHLAEGSAADLSKLRRQLDDSKSDLSKSESTIRSLRSKMETLKGCLDEASAESDAMHAEKAMLLQNISQEKLSMDQHFELVQAQMQREVANANDAVKNSRRDADRCRAELDRVKRELELCKHELSEQQLKLIQEQSHADEMQSSLSEVASTVQGKNGQVVILEGEVSSLKMKLIELEAKLVHSAQQYERLQSDKEDCLTALEESRSQLQQAKSELQRVSDSSRASESAANERARVAELSVKRLSNDVSRLEADLLSAGERIHANQVTMQQQGDELATARRQSLTDRDSLRRQLQDGSQDDLLMQLREVEERLVDSMSQLDMQSIALDDRTSSIRELQRALEVAKSYTEELEAQLSMISLSHQASQAPMQSRSSEHAMLADANKKFSEARAELQQLQRVHDRAQVQLQHREAEITRLKAELDTERRRRLAAEEDVNVSINRVDAQYQDKEVSAQKVRQDMRQLDMELVETQKKLELKSRQCTKLQAELRDSCALQLKATQVISGMQSQLEAAGISPSPSPLPRASPENPRKRSQQYPLSLAQRAERAFGKSQSPQRTSPVRTSSPSTPAPATPEASWPSILGKDGRLDLRSARKIMSDTPSNYDLGDCDF